MVHYLKIRPEYFNAVILGLKTFELRKNDQNYYVGDELVLAEYDNGFTGREFAVKVTYILPITDICQTSDNYVILGIEPISFKGLKEFQSIIEYISTADFDNSVCLEQLRALWTAYCIHNRYECDTYTYDVEIKELYKKYAQQNTSLTVEQFDEFMCEHLI